MCRVHRTIEHGEGSKRQDSIVVWEFRGSRRDSRSSIEELSDSRKHYGKDTIGQDAGCYSRRGHE